MTITPYVATFSSDQLSSIPCISRAFKYHVISHSRQQRAKRKQLYILIHSFKLSAVTFQTIIVMATKRAINPTTIVTIHFPSLK